jgi:para-nitrobenzyl esterase
MLAPFLVGTKERFSMRSSRATFLSFALALAFAPAASAAIQDPVRVEQGQLSGTAGKNPDVRVYKGVPFAAPPVGDLRWKAPQPPASWQGVRQATEFAHPCLQQPYPESSAYYSKLPPLSEDCLYLNIWTAAKSDQDKLPVMVWIHGGGFTRGAGSTPTYDGENFAGKGVVLVTVNYRLGVFGFLALPELTAESAHHASGMYGMLDQIAALQWVKKNIAQFGGDPEKVTIFGESAGSVAVNVLMASPLAKGLFHRAIAESGGSFAPMRPLAEAEKTGTAFAASLGASQDVLKTLRARPADEILKAAADQTTMRPQVDGWCLPQDVYTTFAQGKQNDVPLLVGSNADEGTTLAPQGVSTKAAQFTLEARQRYGSHADQYLKLYPASSDQEAVASFYASFRNNMAWGMHTWARMQTKTGHHPAYRYFFTRRPPGPLSQQQRAYHAAEIAYVFQNFLGQRPWEDADRQLGATMASYWVNFATTGNPNGKGLPKWPAYAGKEQVMELGDKVGVEPLVYKAEMDLFDEYYNSQRQPEQSARSGNR